MMKDPTVDKGSLQYYKEGVMTFRPTYKYFIKTNTFNLERNPAYTDRILFESIHELPQQNPLMNIYYGIVDYYLSDHKPICGLFEAKIRIEDKEKKKLFEDRLTKHFVADNPNFNENSHKLAFMEAAKQKKKKPATEKQDDLPPVEAKGARLSASEIEAIVLDDEITVDNYDFRLINKYKRQQKLMTDYSKFQKGEITVTEERIREVLDQEIGPEG